MGKGRKANPARLIMPLRVQMCLVLVDLGVNHPRCTQLIPSALLTTLLRSASSAKRKKEKKGGLWTSPTQYLVLRLNLNCGQHLSCLLLLWFQILCLCGKNLRVGCKSPSNSKRREGPRKYQKVFAWPLDQPSIFGNNGFTAANQAVLLWCDFWGGWEESDARQRKMAFICNGSHSNLLYHDNVNSLPR